MPAIGGGGDPSPFLFNQRAVAVIRELRKYKRLVVNFQIAIKYVNHEKCMIEIPKIDRK
jgi:hypothetical protein